MMMALFRYQPPGFNLRHQYINIFINSLRVKINELLTLRSIGFYPSCRICPVLPNLQFGSYEYKHL